MKQSHLILSNALIMWMMRLFLFIPQIILVPFLIKTIGEEGYGVYALIWPLLISIDSLEISLQQGAVKYAAGYLAQNQIQKVNEVVSSSFAFSILLAVLASLSSFVAAAFYKDPTGRAGGALAVVGVLVLFLFPLTPFIAVVQSRQRYYIGAVIQTISSYLTLFIVIIWFRFAAPSVEALIVIMAVMLLLSRLVQVPIAYRLVPGMRINQRYFGWDILRKIFAFGGAMILVTVCLMANSVGIRWLMGALVSTAFVAHLAILVMPGNFLSQIVEAMTLTIMPAASALDALGNRPFLQELLIRSLRYATIIAIAAVMAAALLMQNIFVLWVGPHLAFLSPYALALLIGIAFQVSTSSSHHLLKGLGKLKTVIFIYSIGMILVPVGVIFAVLRLEGDPYLAVTAGLTSGAIVCGCLNIVFGLKSVLADFGTALKRIYFPSIIVASPIFLLGYVAAHVGKVDSFLGRAGIASLVLLAFFAGCYFLVADSEERKQANEYIRLIFKRISTPLRRKMSA